jgi:hypothetical protein
MFGGLGAGRYFAMREQASKAKRRDVTRTEFIAAAMADGMTPAKAKQQAKLAKALGSAVLIGGGLLTIRKAKAR